jgi:hypothetical protein
VKLRHQYFAIEQGGPVWESVLRARNFAVYAPAEILNPQMELIILLAHQSKRLTGIPRPQAGLRHVPEKIHLATLFIDL